MAIIVPCFSFYVSSLIPKPPGPSYFLTPLLSVLPRLSRWTCTDCSSQILFIRMFRLVGRLVVDVDVGALHIRERL